MMAEDCKNKASDPCKQPKYVWSSFRNKIRSKDRYGQSVMFNYEGDDTFKTCFGGILSIIVSVTFLACLIYKSSALI